MIAAIDASCTSIDGTINLNRFRGGLVFNAHIILYHSTLGLRVLKQKRSTINHLK